MMKNSTIIGIDEPVLIFPLLVISVLLTSFAIPSLCTVGNNTSTNRTNAPLIAACLANYGINNFTLFPSNHDDNEDSRAYYSFLDFSLQNLRFTESWVPKPTAIIMPESKEQLVKTVLCCRKGSWEIRVRCGGHSYEGTSSVATDGSPFVIIDLMNLDRVSVDLESQVAWVEGGATVGQTYYSISEASKDHGFSAGSCPTVGIGGHIAGGGFGLLSRKYGLAADNVDDALLVDAEGRVLDREAMGEEVFWAIRGGGGGNWGIIYAWKIKLLQVPETVTVLTLSPPDTENNVARLVDKWQHVAPKLSDDFYLSVSVGSTSTIGISATFQGLFLCPKKKALFVLNKVFPELHIGEGDCKEMSWIESVVYFSGSSQTISQLNDRYRPHKLFFKAKSDYVRSPISRTGIRIAFDILEKEPKGYVILDPYGGFMERTDSQSIAFPHRKGNLFSIQYMVEWTEKDDVNWSDKYIHWIRGFYSAMRPYVSSVPRAAYINYMDLDLGVINITNDMELVKLNGGAPSPVERARVWGEKYFLSNYDRLVRAKTLIDPLNVFRHQQSIPPNKTQLG